MAQHNELGKKGEQLALKYLVKKGYKILETNWRYEHYEIDIIASSEGFVVFVEVKTRATSQWGDPSEAVSQGKIKRIVAAADYYLQENDIDAPARFDIVAIVMNDRVVEIEHIDDAFMAPCN